MSRFIPIAALLALVANIPGCASPFHSVGQTEPTRQAEEKQETPADEKIDWEEKLTETGECLKLCVLSPFIFVATLFVFATGHGTLL